MTFGLFGRAERKFVLPRHALPHGLRHTGTGRTPVNAVRGPPL
jgi:hypothetical protein